MSQASTVGVFIKVLQIHLRRHWRSLLVRLVVTSGLLLWLTIPGLVAAGPAWFCGFPSMWTPGDGPIVLRLMVSVIPIALV